MVIAEVSDDNKRGVVIRLSSETDFVAKNEDFIALAKDFARIGLEKFPTTREEFLALDYNGMTIGDKVTEQIGVIGEKIELADYQRLESEYIAPYIHMGYKAGVLVGLNKEGDFGPAGRDVAMQVAAMKPIAVDKDGVDQTIIEKEVEIGKEQARQEGKPEQIIEKIALGKLGKFFKENTLLNQQFVKDGSMSVQQYLQSVEDGLTVKDFRHVKLG